MSIEDRLRAELGEVADEWTPAVESSLAKVRGRRNRRRVLQLAGVGGVVLTMVAIVAVLLPPRLSGVPASVDPAASAPLVGRIHGSVRSPAGLAGRWTLDFRTDGTLDVTPPAGYRGILSAVLFRAEGATVTTTLFQEDVCAGHGVGGYQWRRTAAGVEFVEARDNCPARRSFFVDTTWLSTR